MDDVVEAGSGNKAAVGSITEPAAKEKLIETGSGNKAAAAACNVQPAAEEGRDGTAGPMMKTVITPDACIKKLQKRPQGGP
jgi:hypothetical protein